MIKSALNFLILFIEYLSMHDALKTQQYLSQIQANKTSKHFQGFS